jgi:hypothetical protein
VLASTIAACVADTTSLCIPLPWPLDTFHGLQHSDISFRKCYVEKGIKTERVSFSIIMLTLHRNVYCYFTALSFWYICDFLNVSIHISYNLCNETLVLCV